MDRVRRERDGRTTAKRPEAMGGGRRRENRLSSINNTRCNCPATAPWPRASIARRLTEERWRNRGEGRKNGRQKVKAMDGGSNRARGHCVRATERWRRGACERQKEGEIERDG